MGPTQERGAGRHVALPTRAMLGLAQRVPDLFRYPVALFVLGILRAPDLLFAQLRRSLSAVDRALLDRPEVNAALRAESQEDFRRGAAGLARDSEIYGSPWGFDLADVAVPAVLWHGTDDRNVLVAMGRHVAASLPRCEARILPGTGHFFYDERAREILEAVAGATSRLDLGRPGIDGYQLTRCGLPRPATDTPHSRSPASGGVRRSAAPGITSRGSGGVCPRLGGVQSGAPPRAADDEIDGRSRPGPPRLGARRRFVHEVSYALSGLTGRFDLRCRDGTLGLDCRFKKDTMPSRERNQGVGIHRSVGPTQTIYLGRQAERSHCLPRRPDPSLRSGSGPLPMKPGEPRGG